MFKPLRCGLLSDVASNVVSGQHELDVVHDVLKRRISKTGEVSETASHEKVQVGVDERAAVELLKAQLGEGCNIAGTLSVNKVAGNFHFSMHAQVV